MRASVLSVVLEQEKNDDHGESFQITDIFEHNLEKFPFRNYEEDKVTIAKDRDQYKKKTAAWRI